MKSIYLYIVGALVIVGVAVTPLIVRQNFTKSLKNQKEVLLKQGMKLTIKNEKGYFNGITSFNLQIVDGKKFRDYVLNEITTVNSSFIPMSNIFKKRSKKYIGLALDGTTFEGFVRHSNFLPHKTEVELALIKLSDDTMDKINKKEEIKNLINPLLKEKALTFFIDIDSKENITQIRIKDIDRAFELKNKKTYDFKLIGNKLTINNTKRMAGAYTFDNQLLRANSGYKNLLFQIQGFDYKFDYLNQLDSVISMHADSFKLEIKQRSRATIFKFKNLDINSSIDATSTDTVNIDINYALNNVYLKSYMKVVKLNKGKLDIAILGISKQDLINFSKIYNKIVSRGKYISRYDSKV
ncbi:MAG: hypothetical protein GXP61_10030, partial [Epsilonproteobacteria bacterium]|nr:hypothetical protein [Campylobacterota bacterium]